MVHNNKTIAKYSEAFKTFESNLNGKKDLALHKLRTDAIGHFSETGTILFQQI